MFVYIVRTLRKIGHNSLVKKALNIPFATAAAGFIFSRLRYRAYMELAPKISSGAIPITLGATTVEVLFTNSAQYLHAIASDTEEMIFISYVLKNLNNQSVIYDIGANIGLHTLFFAKNVGEVIAFEPFPNNFRQLEKNIEFNHLENVKTSATAISDKDGTARLFYPVYADDDTSATGLASLAKVDTDAEVTSRDVPMAKLDTIIAQSDLPLPDAIKIDIEGAEYSALIGMEKTLLETGPQLFIEVHTRQLEAEGISEKMFYDLLDRMNYEYKLIPGSERYSSGGKQLHAWRRK